MPSPLFCPENKKQRWNSSNPCPIPILEANHIGRWGLPTCKIFEKGTIDLQNLWEKGIYVKKGLTCFYPQCIISTYEYQLWKRLSIPMWMFQSRGNKCFLPANILPDRYKFNGNFAEILHAIENNQNLVLNPCGIPWTIDLQNASVSFHLGISTVLFFWKFFQLCM